MFKIIKKNNKKIYYINDRYNQPIYFVKEPNYICDCCISGLSGLSGLGGLGETETILISDGRGRGNMFQENSIDNLLNDMHYTEIKCYKYTHTNEYAMFDNNLQDRADIIMNIMRVKLPKI